MKRFVQGGDRTQSILFPAQLDDYIAEDNSVRVIDAFVETLAAATAQLLVPIACEPAPQWHWRYRHPKRYKGSGDFP